MRRLRWALAVLLVMAAMVTGAPWPAMADSSAPATVLLVRPVPGEVLRGFDPPEVDWGAGHRGVDLAAEPGLPVVAAAAGRVSHVGVIAGIPTVSVTHQEDSRLRTTYQPVAAVVGVGDQVAAGTVIGRVASTAEQHPGLHWGLLRGDDYLDPLAWSTQAPIRLLPATAKPVPISFFQGPGLPGGPGEPVRPADGPITSPYGMRLHPVLKIWRLHDGVDLGAACNTPARAVRPGVVAVVEHHVAYGIRVIVDHGDGSRTGYAHLGRATVSVSDPVRAGQRLGLVGTTGWSTGCHLHLMAWRSGELVDPTALVS